MQETSIEWADYSANPLKYRDKDGKVVWACVKHSAGCAHCYAEALALRFGRGGPFTKAEMAKAEPFLDEKELGQLLRNKKLSGKRVFLADMTDLFGEWVPDDLLNRLFSGVLELRTDVTFQILTKRADRMQKYLAWRWGEGRIPARNIWLGVSVENQEAADQRIPLLLQTPAAVRFLSVEPLLGSVDLRPKAPDAYSILGRFYNSGTFDPCAMGPGPDRVLNCFPRIDWVIVGGESGHGARPCRVEWIRSIVSQCKAAVVPCFVKQLGSNPEGDDIPEDDRDPVTGNRILHVHEVLTIRDRKGGDIEEWSDDLRVRQFPEVLMTLRQLQSIGETEAGFTKAVLELAKLHGWTSAHFRPARVKRKGKEIYETPVAGDGRGWPDLILVKGCRIIAAELKSESGKVRPEQTKWLLKLGGAGVECRIWRPKDWDEIMEMLSA